MTEEDSPMAVLGSGTLLAICYDALLPTTCREEISVSKTLLVEKDVLTFNIAFVFNKGK
jgi:hypothetical protein